MDAAAKRKPYATDLTDQEWLILQPLLPAPVPAGAPRTTDLREVVNAILYRLHNGCAWHALPHDGSDPEKGYCRRSERLF